MLSVNRYALGGGRWQLKNNGPMHMLEKGEKVRDSGTIWLEKKDINGTLVFRDRDSQAGRKCTVNTPKTAMKIMMMTIFILRNLPI